MLAIMIASGIVVTRKVVKGKSSLFDHQRAAECFLKIWPESFKFWFNI